MLRSGLGAQPIATFEKDRYWRPSFRRMSWNWIAGFSQRGEQMTSRNGYERTRGYISERSLLLFSLFLSLVLSFVSSRAAYCVLLRAFRGSRYSKKGLWVSICRQIRLTSVIKFLAFRVFNIDGIFLLIPIIDTHHNSDVVMTALSNLLPSMVFIRISFHSSLNIKTMCDVL